LNALFPRQMAAREGSPGDCDRQRADAAARSQGADVGSSLAGEAFTPDTGPVDLQRIGACPFHGNFYFGEEGPFRGRTLSNMAVDDFSDLSAAMASPGDFYAQKQDIFRGLSLGTFSSGGPEILSGLSFGLNDPCYHGDLLAEMLVSGDGMPKTWDLPAPPSPLSGFGVQLPGEHEATQDEVLRFAEVDTPPWPPADRFFTFMVTTLFVSGISAARIGNVLLDYLVATAHARLEKFNPQKFSIKADVRVDEYLSCILKIRLYRKESECVVEFRRCSGDSLLFNVCFRQACDKLMACGGAIVRV